MEASGYTCCYQALCPNRFIIVDIEFQSTCRKLKLHRNTENWKKYHVTDCRSQIKGLIPTEIKETKTLNAFKFKIKKWVSGEHQKYSFSVKSN